MSDNEEVLREEGCEEQTLEERLEETQRLTTQWSVEDEEEAARERRRRERERQQQDESEDGDTGENMTGGTCTQSDDHVVLKPGRPMECEEDEGFSDWSQRQVQMKLQGAIQATEEAGEARAAEEEGSVSPKVREEESEEAPISREEEEEDEGTSRYEVTELSDDPCNCDPEPCEQDEQTLSSHQWATSISESHADDENLEYEPKSHKVPEETNENVEETGYYSSRHEITERTECLNLSIQKSNSIKKSEPPLPISKIDDRLEQYTHAIETSSKQPKLTRTPSLELLTPVDAVSVKKNRWEAGDVTTAAKASPCKDTEGIAIGVSEMISQWGKGKSEADMAQSPCKPTEVRPGDVLSKKNLWEQSTTSEQSGKSLSASKKYKFVPTGHGKYEKVYMEDP
ncbi:lymphocyte specific protein 1 L homeolog isoform X3 [Xenopus laevis]|uniref:Lymphocyte specific protein 1 L homeolog isoform X3 n=1 Tax=Xenopus laevis TaxID=8355 RepID=A0A8J1MUJ0_XENLA|nr:lymphocyte specific protein 1 L homeolog isoform X3 [Xenopus laevis]